MAGLGPLRHPGRGDAAVDAERKELPPDEAKLAKEHTLQDLLASPQSVTGHFLAHPLRHPLPGSSMPATSTGNGETLRIDADYVQKNVGDLAKNADLSRFIL